MKTSRLEVAYVENKRLNLRKKPKNKCNKSCTTCSNCIPIGEGDHLCDVLMELVLDEYSPTDNFYGCGGSSYEKR